MKIKMDLAKDRPSVYEMSIEEMDKVLDKLTDIEEELTVRDEPDNGIMREEWRTLADNALTYAAAVTHNLFRCVRGTRLRYYHKHIEDNKLDKTKYSFSDWEKEYIG